MINRLAICTLQGIKKIVNFLNKFRRENGLGRQYTQGGQLAVEMLS
jgi:hypothetical protein